METLKEILSPDFLLRNLTFQEWRKTKLWGGKPNPPTVYIRKNK